MPSGSISTVAGGDRPVLREADRHRRCVKGGRRRLSPGRHPQPGDPVEYRFPRPGGSNARQRPGAGRLGHQQQPFLAHRNHPRVGAIGVGERRPWRDARERLEYRGDDEHVEVSAPVEGDRHVADGEAAHIAAPRAESVGCLERQRSTGTRLIRGKPPAPALDAPGHDELAELGPGRPREPQDRQRRRQRLGVFPDATLTARAGDRGSKGIRPFAQSPHRVHRRRLNGERNACGTRQEQRGAHHEQRDEQGDQQLHQGESAFRHGCLVRTPARQASGTGLPSAGHANTQTSRART